MKKVIVIVSVVVGMSCLMGVWMVLLGVENHTVIVSVFAANAYSFILATTTATPAIAATTAILAATAALTLASFNNIITIANTITAALFLCATIFFAIRQQEKISFWKLAVVYSLEGAIIFSFFWWVLPLVAGSTGGV